eukprot:3186430-Pleurochrysis_carterae.AAC.4
MFVISQGLFAVVHIAIVMPKETWETAFVLKRGSNRNRKPRNHARTSWQTDQIYLPSSQNEQKVVSGWAGSPWATRGCAKEK